jgi:hypothetical protein
MTFFLIQIKGSRELQQPRRAPHYKKPILAVLFKLRQAFSFLDGQHPVVPDIAGNAPHAGRGEIRGQSTFICQLCQTGAATSVYVGQFRPNALENVL